jgi:hypothetical protein
MCQKWLCDFAQTTYCADHPLGGSGSPSTSPANLVRKVQKNMPETERVVATLIAYEEVQTEFGTVAN